MKSLKTIRLFYIFYTLYTVFVILVSDYKLIYAIVGLFTVWTVFEAYALGFRSSKKIKLLDAESDERENITFPFSRIFEWKSYQYLINAVICWGCSIFAARFYTSRNLVNVITGLLNGNGGYAIYQRYAREANIGAFTISKIPYILMLTYCTAMMFWGIVGILLSNENKRPIQYIYVISIILSYLYFGVARGTNFEMYIVFVSLVYCILNKPSSMEKGGSDTRKRIILVGAIGILVVIVFRIVVESRGYVFRNQICTEIIYDPDKFISVYFPTITSMGLSVFRYLGWGIFTIGYMRWHALDSLNTMIAMFIPSGWSAILGESFVETTRKTVDVGVGWVPDYMSLIDLFGIPFLFIVLFVLGRIYVNLRVSRRPQLLVDLLGLFIFIEMLSIPVGNFLVTSTPILLTLFAALLWYGKCILVAQKRG